MSSFNFEQRGASSEAPFSYLTKLGGIRQILYKGKPVGRPFVLMEKDVMEFLKMFNAAFKLGMESVTKKQEDSSEIIFNSPSSGGLSINVSEEVRTRESLN